MTTVSRGLGLGRYSLQQSAIVFLEMSRKTVVEFTRYPVAFISIFVQIFLIILMFLYAVFTFSSAPPGDPSNQGIAGMLIYGFVINMFLTFTLWEIGFSIRDEQFRGTLESLYLSPANKFQNLVSRVFAVLLWTGAVSLAGVATVAGMVGGLPVNNLLLAALVLLLTIVAFLGLGFVFAAVTIRLKESAQFLVTFLQFFFIIFSAMFFPFAALPSSIVNGVSRWLPVSYNVDLFRSLLVGRTPELIPDVWTEFLIVLLFAILSPAAGFYIYRWTENVVRVRGTLGEY